MKPLSSSIPPVLAAAVLVPMISTVALAVALARRAAERPSAIVLPADREPGRVRSDDVPPEMARDFALVYLSAFDNYTPATIEADTAFLKTRIAPDFFRQAEEALDRRLKVVLESRMSSALVLEKPEQADVVRKGDRREVTVRGVRRIYVADKVREEKTLRYRLSIEPVTPTKLNPYGLAVVGQSVTTEKTREADRDGHVKE